VVLVVVERGADAAVPNPVVDAPGGGIKAPLLPSDVAAAEAGAGWSIEVLAAVSSNRVLSLCEIALKSVVCVSNCTEGTLRLLRRAACTQWW
jgi:hypothetical protein